MVFLRGFDYCGGSGGGYAGVLSRGVVSPAESPCHESPDSVRVRRGADVRAALESRPGKTECHRPGEVRPETLASERQKIPRWPESTREAPSLSAFGWCS